MKAYLDLVETVLTKGRRRTTSVQGVGNTVYPGAEMRFRPAEEFPLITTRSLQRSWRAIVGELLWFLSGSSNVADLHKHGVHLWDSWATKEICDQYGLPEGELGRIYGPQWRSWRTTTGGTIDQVSNLVEEIMTRPDSKRMKVIAWNPEDVDHVFVAPCHGDFKCIVAEGIIDLCMVQRSADLPIGVPFNMASYSLLLLMLAQITGLVAGEFIHQLQDIHIYDNQVEAIRQQLARRPNEHLGEKWRPLPRVKLREGVDDLFSFTIDDFELVGYNSHPYIKIPVAI